MKQGYTFCHLKMMGGIVKTQTTDYYKMKHPTLHTNSKQSGTEVGIKDLGKGVQLES